jgi:hypothetical protein
MSFTGQLSQDEAESSTGHSLTLDIARHGTIAHGLIPHFARPGRRGQEEVEAAIPLRIRRHECHAEIVSAVGFEFVGDTSVIGKMRC